MLGLLDRVRVRLRDVALEDARAVGGRNALGVIEVLDREREAFQRAGGAVLVGLLRLLRLRARLLERQRDERAELRMLGGGVDDFDGRQFARGERRFELDGGLHARKSSSSALTRSGASSCIQWLTPSMR